MGYPEGTLLKLNKSLYGLKQAPRVWNDKLHAFMISQGFSRCSIDRGVYQIKTTSGPVYVAIYVDDILIFGNDKEFIDSFKQNIGQTFSIEDIGEAKLVLGIEIKRDRACKLIHLSQDRYIDKLVAKYRTNQSGCDVPISKQTYNATVESSSGYAKQLADVTQYRSLLGAILYLNVCTRPDISFAVSVLASFCTCAKKMHWNALKDLLSYIRNSKSTCLTYGKLYSEEKHKLYIYADADFGSKINHRRSRTGYVIYFNGGAIAWKSNLQNLVATCTSEAELYAMFDATQHGFQLKELLGEIGYAQFKIKCFEDNTGCVDWIVNQRQSSRMRGIETKFYWLRDMNDRELFDFIKINTVFQKADVLTKQMELGAFKNQYIMLYNIK